MVLPTKQSTLSQQTRDALEEAYEHFEKLLQTGQATCLFIAVGDIKDAEIRPKEFAIGSQLGFLQINLAVLPPEERQRVFEQFLGGFNMPQRMGK